jgi:STAS-like domain of unknown function (DUF4325)
MVIIVRNLIPGADTADQGIELFPHIRDALKVEQQIVVSFKGIQTATSSFVKTAFVVLLKDMPFDVLKSRLKIVDSTRQINQMIKTRLEREALADA